MSATTTLTVPSIKTFHTKPYPAISPLREGLSQAGRTVLITGGGSGIGFEIAKSFIKASAARVIIIGRRKDVLSNAVSELVAEAKALSSPTKAVGHAVDAADPHATETLWKNLKADGIHIDVLVLNAAVIGVGKPILEVDIDEEWKTYEINVKSLLDYTQRFYKQGGDKKKYLVNVSTSAVHNWWTDAHIYPTYGLTKNAGTLLLQQIAKDIDSDTLQIVNYHPGAILTEAAKNAGYTEADLDWDDGELIFILFSY